MEITVPPEKSEEVASSLTTGKVLVAAGRALEAGELERTAKLLEGAPETPESRLLRARLAAALGKHEEAIKLFHSLTDARPDFETVRLVELADELAAAGRFEEAAGQLKLLLGSGRELEGSSRRGLLSRRARWLDRAGSELAMAAYEEAISQASGAEKERLELARGELAMRGGDRAGAESILAPLAFRARRAATMKRALEVLTEAGLRPEWTAVETLERARVLVKRRSWDAARRSVEPLLEDADQAVREDASWLSARILFKRRRHYKEALVALAPIAKGKGRHAEEAELLAARALSRLDQDPEAITAYRAFARKTKRPGLATEARFLAARLEFYLGRHAEAVRALEKMVGNGKKPRARPVLDAGRTRDAHFLAGISALLSGAPRRAAPHLVAASRGSKHADVLARNRYWLAVARTRLDKKKGAAELQAICADDNTSWYARLASRRLDELQIDQGACRMTPLEGAATEVGVKTLEQLSPLAAFFSRAGLYREASAELRRVEKSSPGLGTTRDWVENYVALDAPQFAVRRAGAGLGWPPGGDEWWRAQAAYPTPYLELVREVEAEHGLPPGLIHSIARKESLFDPHAVSSVGAMGMMQMMPHTYETNRKRAGLPPLAEGQLPGPEPSIRAAGFELKALLDKFGGSLPLAVMAYNGGAAAVTRWLERSGDFPVDVFVEKGGFAQTRNYVKRVYRNLMRYRLLAGEEIPELPRGSARPAPEDAGTDEEG